MLSQQTKWLISQIKKYEEVSGQALFRDEQTLAFFSQDFGKLIHSSPAAVCIPKNTDEIISLILFASQNKLPITIRGNGLSQCGQSLPVPGGLSLSMQHFSSVSEVEGHLIWVEANATWADILARSIPQNKAPMVVPYNCNLTVAGVLSAGGVGTSSFKYGTINAHVEALEVIDGLGVKQIVDNKSALFHACLSGQGRFAVITKAKIQLKSVKPNVKTFCLVYSDQNQWFEDFEQVKEQADYMELFCSPSIQGARLKDGKRVPIAQWLYALHVTLEYSGKAPESGEITGGLKPWKVIHTQEETLSSYLLRHNSRFDLMKNLGQWDMIHPWYESFVPTQVLKDHLEHLLQEVPIHYASLVHVVPVAPQKGGFLMLPDADSICSLMILNPGVPSLLKDSCLQAIKSLDSCLMPEGGKRYLSGYLGDELPKTYWEAHFGAHYKDWVTMKKQFDPAGIFSSMLHP